MALNLTGQSSDQPAAERQASRLIWEIWEQNSAKLARTSAMWREGLDTRRPLTCAFETTRTPQNPWCVAHNPEVDGLGGVQQSVYESGR